MGPMGNGAHGQYGHIGNRTTEGMGYKGYGQWGTGVWGLWGTGVWGPWPMRPTGGMGHMGNRGTWGTRGMGHVGNGIHGQWGTGV